HPRTGPMGQLQSLALTAVQDGVIADDVAPANRGEADGLPPPRPGLALPAIDRHLVQIPAQGLGHHLAQPQGRARGRIHLVAVMPLDDLDVDAVAEYPTGDFRQLEAEIDTDAEVGRQADGDAGGA